MSIRSVFFTQNLFLVLYTTHTGTPLLTPGTRFTIKTEQESAENVCQEFDAREQLRT